MTQKCTDAKGDFKKPNTCMLGIFTAPYPGRASHSNVGPRARGFSARRCRRRRRLRPQPEVIRAITMKDSPCLLHGPRCTHRTCRVRRAGPAGVRAVVRGGAEHGRELEGAAAVGRDGGDLMLAPRIPRRLGRS